MKTGNCGAVQGLPKNHRSGGRLTPPCSPTASVNSRSYSIQDIKDRLSASHIEALCRDWLPGGKRKGGWYLACAPWRDDRNPSLGVSLSTGRWKDFATGDKGDMIDLSMKLFGDNLQDTIKGFAEMLGLSHA